MITLFFHGESMGLFSGKTSPDEQLEEQVLYLVSEQISGQAKLANGDTWTARTSTPIAIPAGAPVAVSAINGATAIVRPLND